jgi:hypothetical protein
MKNPCKILFLQGLFFYNVENHVVIFIFKNLLVKLGDSDYY